VKNHPAKAEHDCAISAEGWDWAHRWSPMWIWTLERKQRKTNTYTSGLASGGTRPRAQALEAASAQFLQSFQTAF